MVGSNLPMRPRHPAEPTTISPADAKVLRDENERLKRVAGGYFTKYEDLKMTHQAETESLHDHLDSYKYQVAKERQKLKKYEVLSGIKIKDVEKEIEADEKKLKEKEDVEMEDDGESELTEEEMKILEKQLNASCKV